MGSSGDRNELQSRTRAVGEALLERIGSVEPRLVESSFWEERLLEVVMGRPDLKVQLFRFVDVLPALDPRRTAEHLFEYLGHSRHELPAMLRWGLEVPSPEGPVGRVVGRLARRNVLRMARRFIAGSNAAEAIEAIRRLRSKRLGVTLDVLGEAVLTSREADAYREQYLLLLRETAGAVRAFEEDPLVDRDHDGAPLPRVNVSLKLSALAPVFDPIDPEGARRAVAPRLRAILDAAQQQGGFVYVDMEHHDIKDLTLRIFREVLEEPAYRRMTNVGIVLQAYLRDCERDVHDVARWARKRGAPVWVRLVKGAYWDHETIVAAQRRWPVPVFEHKEETDASFERCTDALLEHADVLRPAIASHNVRSVAHALAAARVRGLPERFVEFQTLYGMADPLKHALVALDQRVRVYTPYGELIPGMAYLVRRLLENTSNESFLRHQMSAGETAESLLAPPAPAEASAEPSTDALPFDNAPLQDFADDGVRAAVQDAIDRVGARVGVHCPLVVGGTEITTPEGIESVNPSQTGMRVGTASAAGREQAEAAVAAAGQGLADWRATPVDERAALVERAADVLEERRNELLAWMAWEAGKPWRDADGDVSEATDFCRYYAAHVRRLAEPQRFDLPGEANVTCYEPRGVTATISPWNFPLAILCGMTVGPLVAGNPVIMKPAEQTPVVGYQLYRALRDAGVPPGALQFLPGEGETAGAALVEHPDVATVVFTGSRAVGHWIARRAIETSTGRVGLKRVVAEMGGKNAIVVDDDCDLDEAVPGVLASAFGYAGQKCSACSRVIVLEGVYEAFLERAAEAAEALVVGPATDPATHVGPLIDRESVERVGRYVAEGERLGRLVYRAPLDPASAEGGHFVGPTILADLPADCSVLREEIFGPVLAVMKASSFDEALALANDTDYALTGGIYSRSPRHIERARSELAVGNFYINRNITGSIVARQPFGGFRHSGMGHKTGGPDYLRQFVVARTLTENTERRGFAPAG